MLCKRCLLNLRPTCTLPGRSFDKTFTAKRLANDKILLVTVWFEWHVSGRNNFLLKSNVTAHDSLHYVMPILNAMQFIDLSFSNDGVITRTYLNTKMRYVHCWLLYAFRRKSESDVKTLYLSNQRQMLCFQGPLTTDAAIASKTRLCWAMHVMIINHTFLE